MAHPIEKKIAERQASLSEVDAEIRRLEMSRLTLQAEIAAYRDTLQYLMPQPQRTRRAAQPAAEDSKRGISDLWASLLKTASDDGVSEFGIEEIMFAGEMLGHNLKRPSVRTQAANMVTRGTIDRVSPGKFRVTPQGMKDIGVSTPNKNGEAKASPDAEQDGNPVQNSKPSLFGA